MHITKLVVLPALVAGMLAAGADDTAKIKGIYIDGGQSGPGRTGGGSANSRLGVKFNVKLDRDGSEKLVRSDYDFVDGDRMRFQFEVNRDSYVYVLHRTLNGDPERLKGIDIETGPGPGGDGTPYRLLYPTQETGRNNKLAANRVYTVPSRDADFVMDRNPGVEKLYLVVSPKPLEITKYFNVQNGKIQRHGRDDSDQDVIGQLSKDLKGFTGNSDTAIAKGIEIDSYAVSRTTGKPMVVEVNLHHYPRRAR